MQDPLQWNELVNAGARLGGRGRIVRDGQLGGFLSDLWNQARQLGENELKAKVSQRYGADHIAAQNEAGADLAALELQFRNVTSAAQLEEAAARATFIGDRFYTYASNPVFGSRGQRGANEIRNLARQLAADFRARAAGGGNGGGIIPLPRDWPEWLAPVAIGGLILVGGYWFYSQPRARRAS